MNIAQDSPYHSEHRSVLSNEQLTNDGDGEIGSQSMKTVTRFWGGHTEMWS